MVDELQNAAAGSGLHLEIVFLHPELSVPERGRRRRRPDVD
jgi:hypothetical protein